jgi:lipopolysaccharide transport system permease protein
MVSRIAGGVSQDGADAAGWTTEITASRPRLRTQLRELWRYRDLLLLLVRRDFVALYRQTVLGPLWYLLQPLLTTVVFSLIFGRIAALPTDGLPPFLFYLSGNVLWSYFAAVLTATSQTFVSNAAIFGKVYFPRLVFPLSVVLSRLIGFAMQLSAMLLLLVLTAAAGGAVLRFDPLALLLLVPALLLTAGTALAVGLLIAALTVRYRDLAVLATFGVQLWLYATPIVYPLSSVPQQYRLLLLLNPLSAPVEAFRFALLGSGSVELLPLAGSAVLTALLLLAALLLFTRVERSFIDTV